MRVEFHEVNAGQVDPRMLQELEVSPHCRIVARRVGAHEAPEGRQLKQGLKGISAATNRGISSFVPETFQPGHGLKSITDRD
ncbi:hypothetical protein GCM10009670_22580 [Citricoccus alkalitolerans]